MSEHSEISEVMIDEGEPLTDEELQGLIDGNGEEPTQHPLLKVWRELLKPAAAEIGAHVTPQWANRMTASYRELNFADMPDFRDRYFGKVVEFAEILEDEIATDDQCLSYTTHAEDAEFNSAHYKALLRDWQIRLLEWELAWDCTAPEAPAELAAISEVHKMFFGQTGLINHLDQIKFEYTEADQLEVYAALEATREGR